MENCVKEQKMNGIKLSKSNVNYEAQLQELKREMVDIYNFIEENKWAECDDIVNCVTLPLNARLLQIGVKYKKVIRMYKLTKAIKDIARLIGAMENSANEVLRKKEEFETDFQDVEFKEYFSDFLGKEVEEGAVA